MDSEDIFTTGQANETLDKNNSKYKSKDLLKK